MKWLKSAFAGFALLLAAALPASAQGPGPGPGPQPPPQLWIQSGNVIYWPNGCVIIGTIVPCTGNKLLTTASTTSAAGFNLPHGAAPSSPINGDVWTTTAGLFVRIGGATVGPLISTVSIAHDATLTVTGGNLGINLANANTWTATQTFAPAANSAIQALVVNQTLPSSGSQPTAFDANVISAANSGYSVPLTGALDSTFGIVPHVSAFTAYMNVSGPASGNDNNAIWGAIVETAPVGFIKGITATAYSNISATGDTIFGLAAYTNVGPSGSVLATIPLLIESAIATGGAASYRLGALATSFGPGQGSVLDSAFAVGQSGPLRGSPPYATSSAYVNALTLYTGTGSFPPLDPAGNVIFSDHAFTTGSFANLSNVTLTGDILNFQNLRISGPGKGIIGSNTIPGGVGQIWTVTAASSGQVENFANPNSATSNAFDGIIIGDSSGNSQLNVNVAEALNNLAQFGVTVGNYARVLSSGSTSAGMLLGTLTSEPLIVGTNNVAWLNLSGAGLFAFAGPQQYTVAQTLASATALHWRNIYMAPGTTTITGNTGSPITRMDAFSLGIQTLTDSSSVTVTDAATLYIDGAPAAAGSVTITNAWALLVGAGNVKFAASLSLGSAGLILAGSGSGQTTLAASATAGGTATLPNNTGTIAELNLAQTWSALQTFNTSDLAINGGSATAGLASVTSGGVVSSCAACTLATSLAIGNVSNTIAAGVQLQVSGQSGVASPSPALSNTNFQIVAANSSGAIVGASIELDTFANGQGSGNFANVLNGVAYGGTLASISATPTGSFIWNLNGCGYDGTSVQCGANAGASLNMVSTEQWASGHRGTELRLSGTVTATATKTEFLTVGGAFTVGLYNIAAGAGGGALCGVNNMTGATGGAITYQNAAACTVSMREFKQDIEPLRPAERYASMLDEIMALHPDQFRFRKGYVDGGARERIGLIADEVESVDPRMATYDGEGKLSGVDYVYSLAIAFKAIQELKADNDNLRETVARRAAR